MQSLISNLLLISRLEKTDNFSKQIRCKNTLHYDLFYLKLVNMESQLT